MGAQYSHLVFRPAEVSSYAEDSLPGFQWFEDPMQDNRKIPIVFYEWKGRNGEAAHFTVLLSSGEIEDMGNTKELAQLLRDVLHVNVLTYDYIGYGVNRNSKPSEKQCYEDITAAYDYLVYAKEMPSDKIILMGKSIGTGPVIHLASSLYAQIRTTSLSRGLSRIMSKRTSIVSIFKGFAGIILQCPMTSVLDLKPLDLSTALVSDMFENSKKIQKIRCPFLFVHGTKDSIIPIKHSQKLSKQIQEAYLWKLAEIEDAEHHNMDTLFAYDVLEELLKFVEYLSPNEYLNEKKRKQNTVPAQFNTSPIQLVSQFLKPLNLEKLADLFISFGYFDNLVLSRMTDDDLDFIGITDPQERELILKGASDMKRKLEVSSEEESKQEDKLDLKISQTKPPSVQEVFAASNAISMQLSVEGQPISNNDLNEPDPSSPVRKSPSMPSMRSKESTTENGASGADKKHEESWEQITAILHDLGRPRSNDQTTASMKKAISLAGTSDPRSIELEALQTKVQLLESLVGAQNDMIKKLDANLRKSQMTIQQQDIQVKHLTSELQHTQQQVSSLITAIFDKETNLLRSFSRSSSSPESPKSLSGSFYESSFSKIEKDINSLKSPK